MSVFAKFLVRFWSFHHELPISNIFEKPKTFLMIYSNIGYGVSSPGDTKLVRLFIYKNRNSAKLTLCNTTTASTTTTSKPPEEGGTYNYPVPEDSLILPTKNTPSSSATDKKQAKKTFSLEPKKTVPAGKSVTPVMEF